jgi:hypothetical protein
VEALAFVALLVLIGLWAAFWVIRLAVRYGVDDALRRNQAWLRQDLGRHVPAASEQ